MNNNNRTRRGIFFTLDAMFAALLIVTMVVLLLATQGPRTPDRTLELRAEDTMRVLTAYTVNDFPEPLRTELLDTGAVTETDNALRTLGVLWATSSPSLTNVSEHLEFFLNGTGNYAVVVGGTTVLENATTTFTAARDRTGVAQPISGIAEGRPLVGSTATALLKKIENKTTASYAFFGGYVGEGNITVYLDLPSDVAAADIISLTLEADIERQFTTRVNNAACGTHTPLTDYLRPTVFDLTACATDLNPGRNTFEIRFTNLTNASIAGGYLRATYTTDEFRAPYSDTVITQHLPGIDGVINLYDSITIPGTLQTLTIDLNYTANDPTSYTEFMIGEFVVYRSNETGNRQVTITSTNITDAGVDYERLSNSTVPLRMVAFNTTQTVVTGGNADVVIITDYSGSMKKSVQDWSQGNSGNIRNCPALYADPHIRRTHIARCLDKEVIDIVLDYPGNKIWPVHYVNNNVYWYNNPENAAALTGFYESYTSTFPQQGSGKTCIACALNQAYDIFASLSAENRSKNIILMSDGLPTHCPAGGCTSTSTAYGALVCEGLCDVEGQNCNAFGTMCTDSSCSGAISSTMLAAQRLYDDLNVTVHTVGFGPINTCTNATQLLQAIATMTNGTYSVSNNPATLRDIYRNISTTILETVTLSGQKVVFTQSNLSPSTLYPDSKLTATYVPAVTAPPPNTIELVRQTPPFNSCTPTLQFPPTVTIREPYLVSYSGSHWTDGVSLNGEDVFNLSDYFLPYPRLGDPYRILLPAQNITATNALAITIGDSPDEPFACSPYNSLVYTAYVPAVTPRTPVLENATGCLWTIEQDSGGFQTLPIPGAYSGPKTCSYTNASITYDQNDAYDAGLYALLRSLDYDNDGRIFVSLASEDVEIIVSTVSNVPYLWGPTLVEVRTWR